VAETEVTVSGVAQRYASALFELARDEKALDEVAGDLEAFSGLLAASEDLTRLVKSPIFSSEEQTRAIAAVLDKAGAGVLTANFIKVVASNRRLFAVPDMITSFRQMLAKERGEISATVTSAEPLSEAQVKALREALKDSMGKDVSLNQKVDASLIGGLVVQVGSRMVDTSLKTKLNALKFAMKEAG
jgi:F-type H+-transporting ATPase subunit delta